MTNRAGASLDWMMSRNIRSGSSFVIPSCLGTSGFVIHFASGLGTIGHTFYHGDMCGIAGGVWSAPDRLISADVLARMTDVLRHRGRMTMGFTAASARWRTRTACGPVWRWFSSLVDHRSGTGQSAVYRTKMARYGGFQRRDL